MPAAVETVNQLKARVLADPEWAAAFGAVFKLVIEGEGGGAWTFQLTPPVSVFEGDGQADCTVTLQASDLIEIVDGELNPQAAFEQGKIRLSGNVSLALKLSELLLWRRS